LLQPGETIGQTWLSRAIKTAQRDETDGHKYRESPQRLLHGLFFIG
jgi:hypothetical protein